MVCVGCEEDEDGDGVKVMMVEVRRLDDNDDGVEIMAMVVMPWWGGRNSAEIWREKWEVAENERGGRRVYVFDQDIQPIKIGGGCAAVGVVVDGCDGHGGEDGVMVCVSCKGDKDGDWVKVMMGESLETASPVLHDAVTTHIVTASQSFMMASARTDSHAYLEDSTHDGDCRSRPATANNNNNRNNNNNNNRNNNNNNNPRAQGANTNAIVCFECGAPGHFRKDCSQWKNKNQGNGNGVARAYAVGVAGQNPDNNVVTGTFLLNNRCASILFDTGADRSFVSTQEMLCEIGRFCYFI
ncbi:putative reverse transcriptase domain-containing protein [Tanacetum coccineum]